MRRNRDHKGKSVNSTNLGAAPTKSGPPAPQRTGPVALTSEDVASFKKLGVEVKFESPFGTFWLVPARTTEDRFEYTPEEIVKLSSIAEMFDGRMVALLRNGEPLKRSRSQGVPTANGGASENHEEQALRDARKHLNEIKHGRQKH
ncbi:MAG: hypothetical protein HYY84_12935 [Deltaproteobacteria bacterium]|nr:hypothetical protein [Deltaproteobacteria bacterium]